MTERRISRFIVRYSCLFLLIGLILPMHAKSQTITEFYIFPNSAPTNISAGSDGNLWFTEGLGDRIGRVAGITTGCTATLDGNFILHLPYLSYVDPKSAPLSLWADFVYQFNPAYPMLIPFKLTTYGIINIPSFSCAASTLSENLSIHIPNVLLPDGITHLWVNLEYSSALSTNISTFFFVTTYGVVPN